MILHILKSSNRINFPMVQSNRFLGKPNRSKAQAQRESGDGSNGGLTGEEWEGRDTGK